MATILVDYENVFTTDGLKGAEYLNENDSLIIFFSQSCEKIRAEYVNLIEKSKCEFKSYKLAKAGKNALDFYIAVECGCLSSSGVDQLCIVSRDKGFSAIADFIRIKAENVTVQLAPNIEKALASLSSSEDVARRRLINEKSRTLSIDSEQARIKEHRDFVNRIVSMFEGTEYEMKTESILKFIEKQENKTPRMLYTGSLHEFGREHGRVIYRMLKNVV